jgi:D-serine deaminase-like pyridoxal phosphate-dependent protein
MRLQLAAGGCTGATCATAAEAAALATAGIDDILVANEVVDREPLDALAALARMGTRIGIAVDSAEGLDRLGRAAAAGATVGVLVDLDVGTHKCGLEPTDPLVVELARRAHAAPQLELRGLMGYEGHAQHEPDPARRAALVAHAAGALAAARQRLERSGLPCDVVSGGGTGTLHDQARAGVLTEIQAGSYVLGDEQYAEAGAGFEQAVWCLATVISRRADRAVANAGLKHLAGDDGPPRVEIEGARVLGSLSDEHTIVGCAGPAPAVGDRLLLSPRHVDPTLNLHPRLWACGPGGEAEEWEIDGRVR